MKAIAKISKKVSAWIYMLYMRQNIQEWTSKFCGRPPLKNFKAVFHKIYLVHSWILCPTYFVKSNAIFSCWYLIVIHSGSVTSASNFCRLSWDRMFCQQTNYAILISSCEFENINKSISKLNTRSLDIYWVCRSSTQSRDIS